MDRIYPEHRTRVSATARITERKWASDDWVEQDSCHPMGSQLMGRKRRAGDRFAPSPYEDYVVRQTENQWDTLRKRALFGSDGIDSMMSGSDVVEVQDYGPPGDGYPMVAQSGLFIEILPKQHGPQVRSWKMR